MTTGTTTTNFCFEHFSTTTTTFSSVSNNLSPHYPPPHQTTTTAAAAAAKYPDSTLQFHFLLNYDPQRISFKCADESEKIFPIPEKFEFFFFSISQQYSLRLFIDQNLSSSRQTFLCSSNFSRTFSSHTHTSTSTCLTRNIYPHSYSNNFFKFFHNRKVKIFHVKRHQIKISTFPKDID